MKPHRTVISALRSIFLVVGGICFMLIGAIICELHLLIRKIRRIHAWEEPVTWWSCLPIHLLVGGFKMFCYGAGKDPLEVINRDSKADCNGEA